MEHIEILMDTEEIVVAKDRNSRNSLHIATLCQEKQIMKLLVRKFPVLLDSVDNVSVLPQSLYLRERLKNHYQNFWLINSWLSYKSSEHLTGVKYS